MTLDEFVAEERARVERFRAMYLAEMYKEECSPDGDLMFPPDMPAGEWDQQLLAYTDCGEERS